MAENGGAQLPVLTLDFDDAKIKALNELAEKFKAAFAIGPGGFPVPAQPTVAPPSPTVPGQAPGGGGGKGKKESEDFLKYLNKELQGTLKTFRLINRTLKKTTSTLKGLFTTTVSWGTKIAAISGGGMFGYGYMSHRVTEQYKSSQGLGMTTGQTQAAHNVFGTRFGFIDNTMQALANGKNPASQEYRALRALGLNPQASAGENLPKFLSAVDRVRKQNGTNAQAVLESMGVGWVGATGLNQMAANSYQIPLLNQQYADQSRQLDQDMGDGTQKSYQDLKANFEKNADEIGNTFLNALKQLNGPITQVSDELTANIKQFLNGGNGQALFKTVADGLKELGAWLAGDDFQKDLDTFSGAVKDLASVLGKSVKWIADNVPGAKDEGAGGDGDGNSFLKNLEDILMIGGGAYTGAKVAGGFPGLAWGAYAGYLYSDRENIKDNAKSSWDYTRRNAGDALGLIGIDTDLGRKDIREVRQWPAWMNWAHGGPGKVIRQAQNNGVVYGSNVQPDIPGGGGTIADQYNNPGNIRPVGGEGFRHFGSSQEGWNAMRNQLLRYYTGKTTGKPLRTIEDIIKTWAPAADKNKPKEYARIVARWMGVSPNEAIDLTNSSTMASLMQSMARKEGYSDWNSQQAYTAAGANVRIQVDQKPGSNIDAQVKGINLWNGK